jgi:hypothetical protein
MARQLKRLTARTVAAMKKPGRHADGGTSTKKAAREAEAGRRIFGECAAALIASKRREWRSEIRAAQWRTTIDDYCGAYSR